MEVNLTMPTLFQRSKAILHERFSYHHFALISSLLFFYHQEAQWSFVSLPIAPQIFL